MRSLFPAVLLSLAAQAMALDIPISIRESASAGALTAEPVTVVFPIPAGTLKQVTGLSLVDDAGKPVPAQFTPLTRWFGNGEYIQQLMVNAQVDLPSGGKRAFRLKDGVSPAPEMAATATEAGGVITVNTGTLKFTVKKSGFNLFDQVWINGKEVIASGAQNGGVLVKKDGTRQPASANTQVTAVIEENGPMRVVLHVFGLTAYKNKTDFTHGFRCRIYAYAGKPWVKVDYALRNTPHADSKQPAGPMYFKDFSLEHTLKVGVTAASLVAVNVSAGGISTGLSVAAADETKKTPGWIDVSDGGLGVMAAIRHFWQMYPMKTEYDPVTRKLKLGFWPAGYKDYYYPKGDDGPKAEADIYWLDDGMQKTHQVCYLFHDATVPQADLAKRSALFERHPVGHVAPAEWNLARSLPDGGHIDPRTTGTYTPRSKFSYGKYDFSGETDRRRTSGTGGLPTSLLPFIANGDPNAYFDWEPFYLMETDVRYSHMDNLMLDPAVDSKMELFTKQYGGTHYKDPHPWTKNADAAYEAGTGVRFGAWDVQHMWIYAFYDMFLMNGDYRIKDFYQELGGFMSYEIAVQEPLWVKLYGGMPPINGRGTAHPLAAVNLAFKTTGNPVFRKAAKDYVDRIFDWFDHADGSWQHEVCVPFMEGFLARSLINFIQDSPPQDETQKQKAISVISAFNDAGMRWAWAPGKGFGYTQYDTVRTPPSSASVSSVTIGDATAWLYLTTGAVKYRDSLRVFMKTYPEYFTNWQGGYTGRTTTYMEKVGLPDGTLPDPIKDLVVTADSKLQFTSKGGTGYVVRWYTKSIRDTHYEAFSNDTASQISWWAAKVSAGNIVPAAVGAAQTLDLFDVPVGTKVHVMIKTIGANGMWSRGSNDAIATITQTLKNPNGLAPKKGKRPRTGLRLMSTPAGMAIKFRPEHPGNGRISLKLIDVQGKVKRSTRLEAPDAEGVYSWTPGGLGIGRYFLKVETPEWNEALPLP